MPERQTNTWAKDEEAHAMSAMLFQNLDLDHNAQLTPDELQFARDLILQSHFVRSDSGEGMGSDVSSDALDLCDTVSRLLDNIDVDHNGLVDREEWENFIRAIYEVFGRRHFLRLSSTWAKGLRDRFALPRPPGPHLGVTLEATTFHTVLLGRYNTDMSQMGVHQQHKWSTSHRSKDMETGRHVSVKIYRYQAKYNAGSRHEKIAIQAFEKQIAILKRLQEPFTSPVEQDVLPTPRSEKDQSFLEKFFRGDLTRSPSDLFIQLVDFTKGLSGDPAPNPVDGMICVVTELPRYTLRDYIADLKLKRAETNVHPLSKESLRTLVHSMLLVIAALHARGFVHLDLQPENFVVLHGHLKLIDMDGCVPMGESLRLLDSTLSFSPCYCSPEWAKFMTDDDNEASPCFTASCSLDVWSLGMIICELVVMQPVMGSMYSHFANNDSDAEEAGLLFMEWLSCLKHPPMPSAVRHFDPELAEFLLQSMLVLDPTARHTMTQCLSDPLVSGESSKQLSEVMPDMTESPIIVRDIRGRTEDHSSKVLHQGTLWKLNHHGDPMNASDWLQRDMWVNQNRSLCYFSQKEGKRLVLCDSSVLHGATISGFTGGARDHAFQIRVASDDKDAPDDLHIFASTSLEECAAWSKVLQRAVDPNAELVRDISIQELLRFRLKVRNHRKVIDHSARDQFEPFFKGQLWKLKTEGDPSIESDWLYRDVWLSKNGSLVYWSQKEDRELIYLSSAEVVRVSVTRLKKGEHAAREWAFKLDLPPKKDLEFSPSFWATDTHEQREHWFKAFSNFTSFSEPTDPYQKSALHTTADQRYALRAAPDQRWQQQGHASR